jgi:hypothetical protein
MNPYKIVTPIIRRNTQRLFSVLIITASQFSPADETPDDLRLFFLSNEKTSLQFRPEDADTTIDISIAKRTAPKLNPEMEQPRVSRLWFSGVVRNGNRIRLLVNDLPCEVVSDESSTLVRHSWGVRCGHINGKHYSLKLRTDKYALLVYRDRKYIATLFVGQSL